MNVPHATVWSCGVKAGASVCRLEDGSTRTHLFPLSVSMPETMLPIVWEGSCMLETCEALWRMAEQTGHLDPPPSRCDVSFLQFLITNCIPG